MSFGLSTFKDMGLKTLNFTQDFVLSVSQGSTNKRDFPFSNGIDPSKSVKQTSGDETALTTNITFDEEGKIDLHKNVLSSSNKGMEKCPLSLPRQPYWQLRIIRKTILKGGFLTPHIYVPQSVWYQRHAKHAGISFKINALEQLYFMLTTKIVPLEHQKDREGLQQTLRTFVEFSDALLVIQNNLSKPFPFIHEIEEPIEFEKNPSKSQMTSMTKLFGSIKKYAEVGYQRSMTVLPASLPDSDVTHYATLVAEVCNQAQLLDDWFQYIEQERAQLSEKYSNGGGMMTKEEAVQADLLAALMTEQHNISTFMREVICELLLRDIEQLLFQYLKKMNDSFTTLPWESNNNNNNNSSSNNNNSNNHSNLSSSNNSNIQVPSASHMSDRDFIVSQELVGP